MTAAYDPRIDWAREDREASAVQPTYRITLHHPHRAPWAGDLDSDLMATYRDRAPGPSSLDQPGAPLWSCCIARPARILRYDDGGATLVCRSCASSMPPRYIFPMDATTDPAASVRLVRGQAITLR